MSDITLYTTCDETRAALGVSVTELPDTVLLQSQWYAMALLDASDLHSALLSQYTTISALPEGSRTAQEQRFYLLVRLFVTYAIARNLLTSLPLFSVAKLSDGRAEFIRQPDVFADVREAVHGMFNKLRIKVSAAYVVLVPTDSPYVEASFSYTSSVGLGVDPVTNA